MPTNLKIHHGKLQINNIHLKTFLITQFPRLSDCEMLRLLIRGDHMNMKESGIVLNYAIHIRPTILRFNKPMEFKLDRLQVNIDASNTGKASSSPRKEEVDALNTLIHFRDNTDNHDNYSNTGSLPF